MTIDFRNINTLWASVLAETLQRLGLKQVVICPGSRSAPLTVALAQQPNLEAIPILDERSAAFFALGLAKQSGQPVALVCTSGTAGANFYPAVIEARESRVPLLVLTADRPPEARHCNAGQAIDQQKLFGSYPNWYVELALPSLEMSMLAYLRQTLIHAWEKTCWPVPGPVHLNLPFREPLAPISDPDCYHLRSRLNPEQFFQAVQAPSPVCSTPEELLASLLPKWQTTKRGIIIAGVAQPTDPQQYCAAIARLSQILGWPVLAEGLSPLRNFTDLNPYLITTYDALLRHREIASHLIPSMVIRIGEMPTSKLLRTWLEQAQSRQWVLDEADRNLDPLHGLTSYVRTSVLACLELPELEQPPIDPYLQLWLTAESKTRHQLDQVLENEINLFEGKAAWLLSKFLPRATPLFVANSMPVRDVEYFWAPNRSAVNLFFNRGANGIDGTLSTALGIAHGQQSSVLLTGDLALLHDTNGFLISPRLRGHLTIVLINNQGGGIFETLPISRFNPTFEEFFATPQRVNFDTLCATYGVEYQTVQDWQKLVSLIQTLPETGVRVLELRTDRKADAEWRKTQLARIAAAALDGLME